MSCTKTASLEELRTMKEQDELLPPKADAPEIDMPDGFWDDAESMEIMLLDVSYFPTTGDVIPWSYIIDNRPFDWESDVPELWTPPDDCEVSESHWLIPTWEVFERVS